MTNLKASIIVGNIPIVPDECYTIAEYQEAKTKAIEALEYRTPKKPKLVVRAGGIIKLYPCPHCSTKTKYIPVYPKQRCCEECGGRLDWSEEE